MAFAFVKDEKEVERMRDISDEEEEDMVKAEAPEFWVEWPNFEWMDEQATKEEEEQEAKRERSEEKDCETPVREKRRRVVDDDEDE